MPHSMTGYGRAAAEADGLRAAVEIRSVNHRYLDVVVRLPRAYLALEDRIRKRAAQRMRRGRLEIFLTLEDYGERERTVKTERGLLRGYWRALREAQQLLGAPEGPSLSMLLGIPDLFHVHDEPTDAESHWPVIRTALEGALDQLEEMRAAEGATLQQDLLPRLAEVEAIIRRMHERSPQVVAEARARLQQRMAELLGDSQVDAGRVAMEAAILAERSSIDEEITRSLSHIDQFRAAVGARGVGRKLDFLVQEMHRELNTIGAKGADARIAQWVVDAKAEVERIREQVQNIE